MSTSTFSRVQIGFCFLVLLLCSACPPIEPEPYPASNLIIMAFNHEVNIDSLKNRIDEDSLMKMSIIDGGIRLFGHHAWQTDYRLWMNDSILLIKVNGFYATRGQGVYSKSGKVRYEQRLRQKQATYAERIKQEITFFEFYNEGQTDNSERSRRYYNLPIQTFFAGIRPVDSLTWNGKAFGYPGHLNFKKGMLHGILNIRDTSRNVQIKGTYDKGMEIGDWEYIDSIGNLQWTETYKEGELQSVVYDPAAHLNRAARISTVREMVLLHRIFFFVFLILTIWVGWRFLKSFRGFDFPHAKTNNWVVFGWIIASPAIVVVTMFLFILTCFLLASLLQAFFAWDLPSDFLFMLTFYLFIYFWTGLTSFIMTFRLQDILWHPILLCLIVFLLEEYSFLKSMGAGVL